MGNTQSLIFVLIVAFLLYIPGLYGGFLLDDVENLKTLDRINSPVSVEKIGSVIFSSAAGEGGRVVAMLTFVAQYLSWPNQPWAFKLVNVFLHLANGCLLYLCCRLIFVLRGDSGQASDKFSVFVVALWVLHPLQVSTVLYVVQRMTELAAFFMLCGLAAYLHGRSHVGGRPVYGYGWMVGGMVLGAGVALMCKEIGVLLPLYLLTLEVTLLRHCSRPLGWNRWYWFGLVLPQILLIIYFGYRFSSWIMPTYSLRDFSLGERLLTESRILWSYVGHVFFPNILELGLFHDDYLVSRAWLSPPVTLLACTGWCGVLLLAVVYRDNWPIFSFGVFWFLGGHLLESSVVPLELYFEHRNYFPLIGVLIAAALLVRQLTESSWLSNSGRRMVIIGVGIWGGGIVLVMLSQTLLWGDPPRQAATWARNHPASERAQALWADYLTGIGRYKDAAAIYASLADRGHGGGGYRLMIRQLQCGRLELGGAPSPDTVAKEMALSSFSHVPIGTLSTMVELRERGACPELSDDEVGQYFSGLLSNPAYSFRRYHLRVLLGRYMIASGDLKGAMEQFDLAIRLRPDVEVALLKVRGFAINRLLPEAFDALDFAVRINQQNGLSRITYARDIENWRNNLELLQQNANARIL